MEGHFVNLDVLAPMTTKKVVVGGKCKCMALKGLFNNLQVTRSMLHPALQQSVWGMSWSLVTMAPFLSVNHSLK